MYKTSLTIESVFYDTEDRLHFYLNKQENTHYFQHNTQKSQLKCAKLGHRRRHLETPTCLDFQYSD